MSKRKITPPESEDRPDDVFRHCPHCGLRTKHQKDQPPPEVCSKCGKSLLVPAQQQPRALMVAELRNAAQHLAKSAKGRDALKALLAWLDGTGLGLDVKNQEAVLILLLGAWGPFAGTARDEMREAVKNA